MMYGLAGLTLLMLAYMFWSSAFRLRRDRLRTIRKSDRSEVILTRRQRVRLQLQRAFPLSKQRPDWEDQILGDLAARTPRDEKTDA